jgi:hypothetical protein
MNWLKTIGAGITHAANQTGRDITHVAHQTGAGITHVAHQTGAGITHVAKQVGGDITNTANKTGSEIVNAVTPAYKLGVEGGVAAGKMMTGPYEKAYDGLKNHPKNPESWAELAEALSASKGIAEKANQTLELIDAMNEAKGNPIEAARILWNKDVMPEKVIKEGPAAEAEYMSGFFAGITGDEAIEHGDAVKLGDVDVAGLRPKSHRGADKKKGASTGRNISTPPSDVKVPQNIATPTSGVKEPQNIPTLPSGVTAPIELSITHFPDLLMGSEPDQKDGIGVPASHKKHPLLGSPYHSHHEPHHNLVRKIPTLKR